MKKRKIYEISVIDKTYSKIISDETKFYTSDTALELVFKLKETEYTFESAEIVLLNTNDKSLITRRVVKSDEGFIFTFEKDIIAHYGEWKCQLMLVENGEAHVSSPVRFRIENDLYNTKPQTLSDVVSWVNLKLYAEKLVGEFKQAVDTAIAKSVEMENTFKTNEANRQSEFDENETTRQGNEDARIEAEQQREETVAKIESRQTFVENQFNAINQELTDKDVISAPEIIAARNGEDTLKVRLDKEHQNVTAQLAQTSTELNNLPFQSAMYNKIPTSNKKVAFPKGFTWTNAPINIFKTDKGEITTDFDAADHKPDTTGTQTYYVSLSGSNSNDGLSEATPFRRVSDALIKADCGEIIVSGGFYPRGQAWAGFSPARNMIIRAKTGEKVVFSASNDLVWTLSNGYTNVYQASRTTVNDVFDARFVNRFGDYAELTKVNSIAEVESTQGSWYTDGTIIYVHTYDGRPADSYIQAYLNTNNAIITTGNHFYIEGIDFEGGNSNIRIDGTDPAMKVVMKDCRFKYTKLLNCVSAYGAEVYMQDCDSSYGNQDGFNYHIKNGVPCKVIEVNCKSHRNGRDGADQNNGSTNHDGGKTIRVNGEYFENHGPNVIDVNEGSESWNLGVVSHNSTATSGISNSNFKNSNVGKGKMWLDSCIAYGSDYSVATAGTGSETNLANNVLIGDIYNEDGTSSLNYETSYVAVSEYQDILA